MEEAEGLEERTLQAVIGREEGDVGGYITFAGREGGGYFKLN